MKEGLAVNKILMLMSLLAPWVTWQIEGGG
jgi:hypothetical protein